MSERIYWRHHESGYVNFTDPNLPQHGVYQRAPDWQRVYVLTDAELAAHDEQVRAEERERIALDLEGCHPCGNGCAGSGSRAARIARQGGSE